jgi:hypothetical protein
LRQLQSSDIARKVTEQAALRFCEDFEMIEDKLNEIDAVTGHMQNEGDDEPRSLRTLFHRTSGEIRVLLT